MKKVDDLIIMANVLASDKCMAVRIESILGNPDSIDEPSLLCGSCPICRNDKLFFTIYKDGMKSVLFVLFIFGDSVIQEKVTLKTLVNAIKSYPRVREKIILGS